MTDETRDAGYDDWLDAVESGESYYLKCPNGHGSLPPRHACPQCADRNLAEEPLPESGEIAAHTVVHVATPRFVDDVPYATAVAAFGPVRLTGVVRGVEPDEVANGATVEAAVGESETTGERLLVLRQR